MNSILTLIITYFLNPVLETSAGIFMIKTQIHQSLRLQISDLIFYLCTILTLLLLALRDYATKNPEDKTINARRIDNMLLKNEYESGDERYKLLLTETDRDVLIGLVEGKPISGTARSRLLDNYHYFTGKIADNELQPAEIYESIGKLQIVNITLDRTMDDAQAIFESLNSTGKELSESDLIRNYVLMGLEPRSRPTLPIN